ncbi:MAG TPA: efflux RND transporter periplasmic adaptor subunit [Verrucomicrobiae bacterium]|jgi:membrane fusion protein (multidrug efflux system)|nr:efflux RND transporter periplasmic adaptor subunit [Verrucomicrobiae bacterium]
MKSKIALAIGIAIAAIAVLAGIKVMEFKTLAATPWVQPPETISSAVVHEEKWQDTFSAVGSITAVQGVTVTPEIAGTISEIAFESGAVVAKGDLLVRFDTSTEEAQLKAANAQLEWARLSLERANKLRADSTVSQSELDQAEATFQQGKANADAIQAVINKKTIRAPFGGKLGIRQINLGEYVDAGKPIVSLQSLTPVYADFSLPQQALAQVKTDMTVRVTMDTYTNKEFEGKLTAINPNLDEVTRSVRLQATLQNPDQLMRPGMFARIEVVLPSVENVLVIPATAILSAPYGDSVYVIEKGTNAPNSLVVRQQFVRTTRARGDFVAVESGLKPGDRVVSAGLFKLRNGAAVTENNELSPKASEKPKPSDG